MRNRPLALLVGATALPCATTSPAYAGVQPGTTYSGDLLRRHRCGELPLRRHHRHRDRGAEPRRLRQRPDVRGVSPGQGPRGEITVEIVDRCTECNPGTSTSVSAPSPASPTPWRGGCRSPGSWRVRTSAGPSRHRNPVATLEGPHRLHMASAAALQVRLLRVGERRRLRLRLPCHRHLRPDAHRHGHHRPAGRRPGRSGAVQQALKRRRGRRPSGVAQACLLASLRTDTAAAGAGRGAGRRGGSRSAPAAGPPAPWSPSARRRRRCTASRASSRRGRAARRRG